MNRRGMALLLVLWLLVAISSLAGVTLAGARVGHQASRNRLTLTRAGWAADGCLAMLRARYSASTNGIDSVDLGRELWCRIRVSDPGTRVNLNLASREMLVGFTGDSALADSIIVHRPYEGEQTSPARDGPVTPLPLCLSACPPVRLSCTIRGDGRINLNTAPEAVLRAVPGVGADGARQLATSRRGRPALRSPEEAVAVLPATARARVMTRYAEFVAATTLSPTQLIAEVEGHLGASTLVAHATITLIPTGTRLAVIRQEID